MARIRTVKPDFWVDEKVGELPIPCRLFFIGCWTFADDFGVIKGNAALLKSQIFPYDESLRVTEVKKWIDALVDARMLVPIIHAEESYYLIRTFRNHQVLDSRYCKSYINKEYANNLIKKALNDNNVTTPLLHCDNKVLTSAEKEMEKEDTKKELSKESQKETRFLSAPSPLNPDYLKFQDWVKENAPYCHKNMNPITEKEFLKLKEKYGGQKIADVISQIENRKDKRKNYVNLYRTVLNWSKNEYGNK